jgi:hypothetical protein
MYVSEKPYFLKGRGQKIENDWKCFLTKTSKEIDKYVILATSQIFVYRGPLFQIMIVNQIMYVIKLFSHKRGIDALKILCKVVQMWVVLITCSDLNS